jgi:hypothetical protein
MQKKIVKHVDFSLIIKTQKENISSHKTLLMLKEYSSKVILMHFVQHIYFVQ